MYVMMTMHRHVFIRAAGLFLAAASAGLALSTLKDADNVFGFTGRHPSDGSCRSPAARRSSRSP
jgi:hypothetical protein